MSVHYKFKSTLDYDTVSFDGLHISVADLKKAIFHQKRIGKNTDFDLQITNAQTKEDYTDDNALIAKNTSLIVARVPLTVQQKRSWDRNEPPSSFSNVKEETNLGRAVDLTRLDGSEEDKIRAMMTQSTQDYDPSNYMKIRGANQTGDVPANYRCYKCHQPGHWIKNCPLGTNQEPIEIKKSTGIPRSFMVPVEGPLVPGAMMTPTGQYAVPAIDHQAYKEGKKERPPFSQDPEPVIEKLEIPEDLLCNICKDLLTDAVMIPCCGNSFCDECIRTFLLESEEHECPDCNEKDVSPETLIPNRFLRNAVMNFKNETGYAKRQTYRPPQSRAPTVQAEQKVEVQQNTGQAAGQSKCVQAASVANAPSQDYTEAQPATFEGGSQYPASNVKPQTTTTRPETLPEPELQTEPETKLTTDEEAEVPPPPGTEPLLPIPAIGSSPERDRERSDPPSREKKDRENRESRDSRENDYPGERQPRERRRSFSRETHRERSGDRGRRIENLRPLSRRRSLSPRHSQHGDYPPQGPLPHLMNPPSSKGYQGLPSDDGHYTSAMHYDGSIRRSTEDRPGTPTVDEPHLHVPSSGNQPPLLPFPPGEDRIPPPNYNQPPPNVPQHNPPLLPDPYMSHRIPMYPHQQGSHYGPPRYERPPYQQQGFRPSQPPRNYNGPPRPMRGLHHIGYRGVQPPPPGLSRNIHNGNPPGIIDDPLEAFERMLREKDERDRRLGKHRRRSRTRSRSRSYSRSRSRSFSRRSPFSARLSRSRSPPLKRRSSRSPLPLRARSRTPKRRSRSGSFSISRSRSYSRSQSPRLSLSRDRDRERDRDRDRERDRERDRDRDRERDRDRDRDRERDRERDRDRDRDRDRELPPRYRSPARSPPRFQRERDRERERPRSREPREGYNNYYNDSPSHDYQFRDRERDIPPRDRPIQRYPLRNQPSQHNIPPLLPHLVSGGHPPPLMSLGPPSTDRKDYYDSYNRYSGPPNQRFTSPVRDAPHKRFDDVAPPGTEGYYDLSPPGVEHSDRTSRDDRDRQRPLREPEDREHPPKDHDAEDRDRLPLRDDRARERDDRGRERDDRDRRILNRDREDRERQGLSRDHEDRAREKDDRDRRDKDKERDDRHLRDRRDEDRHVDKDRYRDERDRHRPEDKSRNREKDRRDRDYDPEKDRDRHERYDRRSVDRKKGRKSPTPYSQKTRTDAKEISPERIKKKEKDHEEKADEKKKEKKIKEKKKKKDSEEKEKKKKKKKEKKSGQKEATKDEVVKAPETEDSMTEPKTETASPSKTDIVKACSEDENIENRIECIAAETTVTPIKEEFEDKSLAMNPEPPEFNEASPERLDHTEFGTNPPNPNFKPIPELKSEMKPIDSLYGGLDDAEINTVITEKYSLLSENETEEKGTILEEKSPKKDEFLAPLPELSKWERDDTIEKADEVGEPSVEKIETDEPKSTKVVTSEVLKRAENAIFQKAINAIRPIEIKKISESRKILYQNPEPKVLEAEPNREQRKSVNVTINVGRNERNVEITEPVKKAKLDRTKFKPVPETYSPTRLSAKERLGEKVEDNKERKISPIKGFLERRETKNENQSRSRSPRGSRDKRISPILDRRIDPTLSLPVGERKVFLDDRKRDKDRGDRSKDRNDFRNERHDMRLERDGRSDSRGDFRTNRTDSRGDRIDKDREKERERERRGRTPPCTFKRGEIPKVGLMKGKDEDEDRRRDKKIREEKKRKKEHRSRSKSKEHKKRKEKKHKKDKEKNQEKKQKHKESVALKDKPETSETKINYENPEAPLESLKKQRKNPRLVSDRKRSILDEASFEPDYSASDSESDGEDNKVLPLPAKKLKLDEPDLAKEIEMKALKKRSKSTSSEDSSSSSESTSTDSDSSDESHKKKKKKHKKHKKKKSTKKDSSSDTDSYSDSSDSSSDEEKHRKKSKKSKSRSKQSKKKKKSKHK